MAGEKTYKIGRFELVLPSDHALEMYQTKWKLYDWILGEISRLVFCKYPDATVVDVGANVGDSAALICNIMIFPFSALKEILYLYHICAGTR